MVSPPRKFEVDNEEEPEPLTPPVKTTVLNPESIRIKGFYDKLMKSDYELPYTK